VQPVPLDTTPAIPFPEPLQPQPQPDTAQGRQAPRDTIRFRDPG
jgi:hypothetical protein